MQQTAPETFEHLVGVLGIGKPYRWQQALYESLRVGNIPESLVVPTAAGKTLLLVAFVAALAAQALAGRPVTLPRRLVHVVNRRLLVDEAGRLAERLQETLAREPSLYAIRQALSSLSCTGEPLVVSTLRGGLEDNGAWSMDPSTPALILATPDMLGSRLLFRGYGLGRSRAASHAGLLGCDTLIVHDEAHLAPAFTSLLRQVEFLAAPGAKVLQRPPLTVMEMTATSNDAEPGRTLVCDINQDERLKVRMSAAKRLKLVDVGTGEDKKSTSVVVRALVSQALGYRFENKAVALFISRPAEADKVAGQLIKAGVPADRVALLTGTMRGHERTQLSHCPAYRRFDPGPERTDDGTAYFIATSAGEIGLDMDADVGLFDLTTLDRFIQRCGRVNRRGLGVGDIFLVHARGNELGPLLQNRACRALDLLSELESDQEGSRDASPWRLSLLVREPAYAEAVEPVPALRRLEPSVLNMLAMTSLRIDELRCPAPDVYIHGLVEEDPRIHLAWRRFPRQGADLHAWLDALPLTPGEMAPAPLEAASRLLRTRLTTGRSVDGVDRAWAMILDRQGAPLEDAIFGAGDRLQAWLRKLQPGVTVLLESGIGGLSVRGLPDAEICSEASDVSMPLLSQSADMPEAACLSLTLAVEIDDDGERWRLGPSEVCEPTVQTDALDQTLKVASVEQLLAQLFPNRVILFHDAPRITSDWMGEVRVWMCRRTARAADGEDRSSQTAQDRELQEHLDLTGRAAAQLASALGLKPDLGQTLTHAGAWHDLGKRWACWQHAIGHHDLGRPLGKTSSNRFDHRINDGYRHELGTLVDLRQEVDDLSQHLMATHHGWGRPIYRAAALNKPGCLSVGLEVGQRFDRLSQALGPWALCYLEALLKAADVLAEVQSDRWITPTSSSNPREKFETTPLAWSVPAPVRMSFQVDVLNLGEYLAALGLVALLDRQGHIFSVGWNTDGLVLQGVAEEQVRQALRWLCEAKAERDQEATVTDQREGAYPPLRLVWSCGATWPLNPWLDETLHTASGWKLGAGQTTAFKTLDGLLSACARAMKHEDFSVPRIMHFGGLKVGGDASKFRMDAATNWSAQDAGFSLNESDAFKSTRPWVELLSVLGLQTYFAPPADEPRRYFVWEGQLSPSLSLAAVKGLWPTCTQGYEPLIVPNGKMKDVFTSQPIPRERTSPCKKLIRVI